jgi:hypothetical protein
MRKRTALGALGSAVLLVLAATSFGAAPGTVAAPRVEDLAWLAGCWDAAGGEPGSEEHWLAPAGGTLFGISRTVRGGQTVTHELMQIRERGPGELVFIASPAGQATTTFPLVAHGESSVTFENPEHDFPQRVIYRRDGDVLRARIEGTEGGKEKGFDFPFRRRDCDAEPARVTEPLG